MGLFVLPGLAMVGLTHRVKDLLHSPPPEPLVDVPHEREVPTLGPLLIFKDPSLEQEFLRRAQATWTKCDIVTYIMAMVVTVSKILSFSRADAQSKYLHGLAVLIPGFVAPGALLIHVHENPIGYQKRRTKIMSMIKVVIGIGQVVVSMTEDPYDIWNAKEFPHILLRGFSRTPFPPMFVLAIGNPIPFWWHVVMQSFLCTIGAAWVPKLSGVCDTVPLVREAFARLGHITEGYLALFGPFAAGASKAPQTYSCEFVASFYTIFLQFLAPSYLIYLLECGMRLRYLREKMSEDESALQSHLKYCLVALATVSLFLSLQIVWFGARSWGEK